MKKRALAPPATFRAWKERQGLTEAQIAERLRSMGVEVSRPMIGAIARGHRCAGLRIACALRDLTGLPLSLFLSGETRALLALAADESPEAA